MDFKQIHFDKVREKHGLSAASITYNPDDQLIREYDGVPIYNTLQPVYDVIEPEKPTLTREPVPEPLPIIKPDPIYQPTQPDDRLTVINEPVPPKTGGVKSTEPIDPVEPIKEPVKEPVKPTNQTEPIGTTSVQPEPPKTDNYSAGGMKFNSLWWIGGIVLASYIAYQIYDKPEKKKNN